MPCSAWLVNPAVEGQFREPAVNAHLTGRAKYRDERVWLSVCRWAYFWNYPADRSTRPVNDATVVWARSGFAGLWRVRYFTSAGTSKQSPPTRGLRVPLRLALSETAISITLDAGWTQHVLYCIMYVSGDDFWFFNIETLIDYIFRTMCFKK